MAMIALPIGVFHWPSIGARGGGCAAVSARRAMVARIVRMLDLLQCADRPGKCRLVKIAALGDELDVARMTARRRRQGLRRIARCERRSDDVFAQVAKHGRVVL